MKRKRDTLIVAFIAAGRTMTTAGHAGILRTFSLMLIVVLFCPFAYGKVMYVDDDVTGTNDGSSWANAFNYLQDALADANSGEKPVEIRVAQGAYKPDLGAKQTLGDQQATFQLISGLTLKGGYAGPGEPDPDARDIEMYETILSGDLAGNDVTELVDDDPSRDENSFHVLTGSGTDETAVLDGFIITGAGQGIWPEWNDGGGMYNHEGSPSLTDCIFVRNCAFGGGGMWNEANSNPILTNCTFVENESDDSGGGGMVNIDSHPKLTNCKFLRNRSVDGGWWGYGAGMLNHNSSPVLTNCTFIANGGGNGGGGMYNRADEGRCAPTLVNCIFNQNDASAMWNDGEDGDCTPTLVNCIFSANYGGRGGGMCNEASHPTLTNCTFSGNWASGYGGGMHNEKSAPRLTDCIFSGNAAKHGGGMYNRRASSPTLTHCTFSGNCVVVEWNHIDVNGTISSISRPGRGGGVYNDDRSMVTLANCILWGDSPDEMWLWSNATVCPPITYSNIQGGWPGEGNIDVDPLFADPGHWAHIDDPNIIVEPSKPNDPNAIWVDGDYHLKSQAGRWNPNSESWAQDEVTSPCIDAGDPNSSVGLEPVPHDGIVNMGAYGGTAEASKSPW